MWGGCAAFALFVVTAVVVAVDPTPILGIGRWIKPSKFFISIAIYMWTIGAYLYFLNPGEKFSRRISWAFNVIFAIEMTAIVGQPLRGTTSHFNIATPLDSAVFSIMGIAILTSTLLAGYIAFRYFYDEVDLPPAVLWGMRLGLVIFLAGSAIGGYMSAHLSHTVGAADGGPGLTLVNWSTTAGDLRIAHFLGLHALQAVPLFALVVEKLGLGSRTSLTVIFAALYLAAVGAVLVQAMMGRPLLAL